MGYFSTNMCAGVLVILLSSSYC